MERIEKLRAMLEQQPEDNFLRHAMALELIKKGDDGEARILFESILDQDPAYIGSYYHLGKLLERAEETGLAEKVYQKGMEECMKVNDRHSLNELRGAYDDLTT